MKRYSIVGLLLILAAVAVSASIIEVPEAPACGLIAIVSGGVPAAGSACEDIADDPGGGNASIASFGAATILKRGQEWITGETGYNICKFKIQMRKVGTPAGTATLSVNAASGGSPSTVVATANETKAASDLTTTCAVYTFTLPAPVALTGTTAYYIVASASQTNDGSNYFALCYTNSGTEDMDYYESSWATGSSTTTGSVITYK